MSRMIDLVGRRFGRLVVQSYAGKKYGKHTSWNCLCDCGKTVDVIYQSLIKGRTTSCGCYARDMSRVDITGIRFGRLVAREDSGEREFGVRYGTALYHYKRGVHPSVIFNLTTS